MIYRALGFVVGGIIIDMVGFGYLQYPFPYVSRVLFYTLVASHVPFELLVLSLIVSLCPLFFVVDGIGMDLLVSLLLGWLAYYICSVAHLSYIECVIMVASMSVLHSMLLRALVGNIPCNGWMLVYTFLSAVSVVYSWRGSQGNRLRL